MATQAASSLLRSPGGEIELISNDAMHRVSEIKLIRTDTTLDLSLAGELGPGHVTDLPEVSTKQVGGREWWVSFLLSQSTAIWTVLPSKSTMIVMEYWDWCKETIFHLHHARWNQRRY